jgi:hypothetical protein
MLYNIFPSIIAKLKFSMPIFSTTNNGKFKYLQKSMLWNISNVQHPKKSSIPHFLRQHVACLCIPSSLLIFYVICNNGIMWQLKIPRAENLMRPAVLKNHYQGREVMRNSNFVPLTKKHRGTQLIVVFMF